MVQNSPKITLFNSGGRDAFKLESRVGVSYLASLTILNLRLTRGLNISPRRLETGVYRLDTIITARCTLTWVPN